MVKDKQVNTRLTKVEYERLEKVAKKHKRSISFLVREGLLNIIEKLENEDCKY